MDLLPGTMDDLIFVAKKTPETVDRIGSRDLVEDRRVRSERRHRQHRRQEPDLRVLTIHFA